MRVLNRPRELSAARHDALCKSQHRVTFPEFFWFFGHKIKELFSFEGFTSSGVLTVQGSLGCKRIEAPKEEYWVCKSFTSHLNNGVKTKTPLRQNCRFQMIPASAYLEEE